jgi:hypothetical protein
MAQNHYLRCRLTDRQQTADVLEKSLRSDGT